MTAQDVAIDGYQYIITNMMIVYSEVLKGLTVAEQEALGVYTYPGAGKPYEMMNTGLRGFSNMMPAAKRTFIATWGPLISRLQRCLVKPEGLPSVRRCGHEEETTAVYRGLEWKELPDGILDRVPNKITFQAFTSTSVQKKTAMRFIEGIQPRSNRLLLTIFVSSGKLIESVSMVPHEGEVRSWQNYSFGFD